MRRREYVTAPRAGHACPACHEPVAEKITRHRTWGLFVPVWKAGPCRNPECPRYVPRDGMTGKEREELVALRKENRRLRENAGSARRSRGSR